MGFPRCAYALRESAEDMRVHVRGLPWHARSVVSVPAMHSARTSVRLIEHLGMGERVQGYMVFCGRGSTHTVLGWRMGMLCCTSMHDCADVHKRFFRHVVSCEHAGRIPYT